MTWKIFESSICIVMHQGATQNFENLFIKSAKMFKILKILLLISFVLGVEKLGEKIGECKIQECEFILLNFQKKDFLNTRFHLVIRN